MRYNHEHLTVCVPTANRPQLIFQCLTSILNGTVLPSKILVLDMSTEPIYEEFKSLISSLDCEEKEIIEVNHQKVSLSPSAARFYLTQNVSSELILFLDDDMAIEPKTIEVLIDVFNSSSEVNLLGCGVLEYGIWRDIGFKFDIGVSVTDKKFVSKKAIRKEWMDLQSIKTLQVDLITQPPFLLNKSILKKVNFDGNYQWSHEIFDFFYACYCAGIPAHVTTTTHVNHYPTSYSGKTVKDEKLKFNIQGKKYFEKKWGLTPIKELRKRLLIELFFQVIWRMKKKKMVKNKIKKDGVKYH